MNYRCVSQSILEKAQSLYDREDFLGSSKLLQEAFDALESNDNQPTAPLSEALVLLGWNLVALQDFSGLKELENRFADLEIIQSPEFELIRIWVLGIQGKTQLALGKTEDFLRSQGTQISRLHPDFLMVRGRCLSQAGERKQPILDCEAAYSIFLVQQRKFGAGQAANFLGNHYQMMGNFPKALEWYNRSDAIFETLNLPRRRAILTLNLGTSQYKLGNLQKAGRLLKKCIQIDSKKEWPASQCNAHIALGNVYRMKRKFDLAHRHLNYGLAKARALSMVREEALALEFLGDVHRDEGRYADAQEFYSMTLAIIEPIAPKGDVVSETHRRIGECFSLNGQYLSAKPHFEKALELTRHQGDRFEEGVTLRVMAESSLTTGDLQSALKYILSSCEILEEIGAHYELAISHFRFAEILVANRHESTTHVPAISLLNQAWHHASNSLNLFQKTGIQWWVAQAHGLVKRIAVLQGQQEKVDLQMASSILKKDGRGYNPGNIIVHNSQSMRQLIDICDLYAPNDSAILIRGETGTGKELIARRLHERSGRSGELVSVNVASISSTLFEREFFGHVKGAFSGADNDSIGFAEKAHKGTLFLDEIGELPLELQPKLLRLLQDGAFHAVGDPVLRQVDIRLVAATNVDLFLATKNGAFREDLFYRLQTLSLEIPSLKDRPEDIIPLMEHFLSVAACRKVVISEFLNPSGIDLVESYDWPGNVREVISICQRIHLQNSTTGFCSVQLGQPGNQAGVLYGPGYLEMKGAEGLSLDSIPDPKQRLAIALETSGGNRKDAAKLMGISRSTLYRHMKQFNI